MRHMNITETSGGARLRTLREAQGMTQLALELEASLGTGYLQRLELGKVQQPQRETLERILAVLRVSFAERRAVLELFGYAAGVFAPTDDEVQWAVAVFRTAVEATCDPIPAYLLDCSHRLLAWTETIDTLFGADCFRQRQDGYISMPRLVFDPVYRIAPSVLNDAEFFRAQIRNIQYERQRSCDADWYNGFVEGMRRFPLFDRYWDQYAAEQTPTALRPLALLVFRQGDQRLRFRLISEPFVQDNRFRVIYYLPADSDTIQQCNRWQAYVNRQ
ncbi:MAG: helix-turn-helix transcriptional regulator [Anaerolineae bacterium]